MLFLDLPADSSHTTQQKCMSFLQRFALTFSEKDCWITGNWQHLEIKLLDVSLKSIRLFMWKTMLQVYFNIEMMQ